MVQGYDRREGVQDPNAPSANPQPSNLLPLGQVMHPQPSSFKDVGGFESDIASVLSKAGPILQEYVDKKKPEWRMDGILAQQQGKSEAEVSTEGNKYTVEGFTGMQAVTALQDMTTAKMQKLTEGDQKVDPTSYRKELLDNFAKMTSGVQSSYVKSILVAHSEQALPALLAEQIKANHAWKRTESINAATGLAASTANKMDEPGFDKRQLNDIIANPEKVFGLSSEDARQALSTAMKLNYDGGNGKLANAIIGTHEAPVNTMQPKSADSIINFTIDQIEGNGAAKMDNNGHMVKFGINGGANNMTDDQIKNLTKADAIKIYKAKYWTANRVGELPAGIQAAAFDAYVQHGPSAKSMVDASGSNPTTLASLRMAKATQLEASGLSKFKDFTSIMKNRLEKLIQIPSAEAATINGTVQNDLVTSLLAKDFTAAQVQEVLNAKQAHDSRKVADYNTERLKIEDQLNTEVRTTGNPSMMYDKINRIMKDKGYTIEWGNRMANEVQTGFKEYQKNTLETAKLTNALSTNSLGLLTKDEKDKALVLARTQDQAIVTAQYASGAYNEEAKARNMSPEQVAQEKIQHIHYDRLAANRVVDEVVAQGFQQTMRMASTMAVADIQDPKTGQLTPAGEKVVNQLGSYYYLRAKTNPGFARKFLDDDSAKLMNEVIARDSTGQNLIGALSDANASLNRPENMKVPPINVPEVHKAVGDWIDQNLNPGFFDWMTGGAANQGPLDVFDNEVNAWKKDPILNSTIANIATKYKSMNPAISIGAAVQEAISQVRGRGAAIGGSWVMAPEGKTVESMAGLSDVADPMIMNAAVADYMKSFGKDMWPEIFNETQLVARPDLNSFNDNKGLFQTLANLPKPSLSKMGASIADLYRGVPEATYKLNPQNGTLVVDLYRNKEGTVLRNMPREIPLSEIGTWWKENHTNPTVIDGVIKSVKAVMQPIVHDAITGMTIGIGKAVDKYVPNP